jgi:endonuclease NucS-like protein
MPDNDIKVLPLKSAYTFLQKTGHTAEAQEIRTSKAKLGGYTSSLRRARVLAVLQKEHLLDQFIKEAWNYGGTPDGSREIKRLTRIFEKFQKGGAAAAESDAESELEVAQGKAFAVEEHLRDYLAENLYLLEKGLKLWPVAEDEDAVEYPVDGRRIDIFAQDSAGLPVIIELKVSRGHEKTIGQALYYRAKIKEKFKVEKVRILIVALEVSTELRLSAKELPDVSLFEYSLSMAVKQL